MRMLGVAMMTDAELTREERRLMENNNAKLREALDDIGNACAWIADNCNDGQIAKYMWDIVEKVNAALAAPPRNCDIYTDIDSAFRACQEDRGYLKSPIDERRSVISFMLSTNTSGEANKDEGEPDESK